MKKKIIILLLSFSAFILILSLRGNLGNPSAQELNTPNWEDNGPLELSPERGRFALLYSIVEDHSFHFSVPVARFATPDLGFSHGNYVSLFAPLVSFIVIPGYLIGKLIGASQAGSVAVISLFAILNLYLIYAITYRFTRNFFASLLAGFTFLFATPAFTYAVTLYQHHISTFLILSSLYVIMRWKNLWSLAVVWFMFVLAIPTDYPNLIFLFPLVLYAMTRFFALHKSNDETTVKFHYKALITFLSVLLPLTFFFWFNIQSYDNPLQLSGTLKSVKAIMPNGKPATAQELAKISGLQYEAQDLNRKKTATGFFKTRRILDGLYIHTVSSERGIIYYTPVVLFGIFGFVILYKKKSEYLMVLVGIIGATVLLYSMWSDPWGGWAFGSRYLIPVYALLAIGIGVGLDYCRKKKWLLALFFLLFFYSVSVNTLGAITTSRIPPKAEAQALEPVTHQQERYSYDRSYQFLLTEGSKSLVWKDLLKPYLSAQRYYYLLTLLITITGASLLIIIALNKPGKEYAIDETAN